jgi:hypothetical protein
MRKVFTLLTNQLLTEVSFFDETICPLSSGRYKKPSSVTLSGNASCQFSDIGVKDFHRKEKL